MKSKIFKSNLLIPLITIAGFAIAFYFYLDVYSKNKQADIIETKSRVLVQMSDNLKGKINSFKGNAKWMVESGLQEKIILIEYTLANTGEEIRHPLQQNVTTIQRYNDTTWTIIPQLKDSIWHIKHHSIKKPNDTTFIKYNWRDKKFEDTPKAKNPNVLDSLSFEKFKESLSDPKAKSSNPYLNFKDIKTHPEEKIYDIIHDTVTFKKPIETIVKASNSLNIECKLKDVKYKKKTGNTVDTVIAFDSLVVKFSVRYNDLLEGIKKEHMFQEHMLINNGKIVYSSISGNPVISPVKSGEKDKRDEELESGIIEIVKKEQDRYSIEPAAIKGVSAYDINISNKEYKIFICQLTIDDENWQFCGLVESARINDAKRRIAPGLIVIVFMILSLIVLGLPFIQLKVITPTEQLNQGAMINAAISVFLGACFVFIFLFFQGNVYWRKKQNEHRLKEFAKEISDSLNNEIKAAWKQINSYDTLNFFKYQDTIKQKKPLKKSAVGLLSTTNDTLKPKLYKYYDYVFWMPKAGKERGLQIVNFTTFSKLGEPSTLSHRDYFSKADEWIYPHDSTQRFRMESVVSVSSGIAKVAISRPSVSEDHVVAMTGQFHSVIEPIVPAGFKFCITDGSGKVWFHSDKGRNMVENILEVSRQNKYLQAALYAGASDIINLNYYDEPHRAFIRPVEGLPLYIVTLYDKQVEYSYQQQALMLTLLLLSALIIFIVLQIIVLFAIDTFIKKPGSKSMMIDFIRIKSHNTSVYLLTGVSLFFATASYWIFTDQKNVLNPLILSVLAIAYFFPFLNYAIAGFSLKSKNRNLFAIFNLLLIVFINFSSIELPGKTWPDYLLCFQFGILLIMCLSYLIIRYGFIKPKTSKYSSRYYIFFLLMLLLFFGIAPSVKNFEAAVNYELLRESRHTQFELANSYKSRNIRIKNYFKPLPQDDSTKALYEERIKKGIYTGFVSAEIKYAAETNEVDTSFIKAESLIKPLMPLSNRLSIERKYLDNLNLPEGDEFRLWKKDSDNLIYQFTSGTEQYIFKGSDKIEVIKRVQRPAIFNPWFDYKASQENTEKDISNVSQLDKPVIVLLKNIFFRIVSDLFSVKYLRISVIFIFIFLLLSAIYFLIRYSVRNMFGFPVLETYNEKDFYSDLKTQLSSGLPVFLLETPFGSNILKTQERLKKEFILMPSEKVTEDYTKKTRKPSGKPRVIYEHNFGGNYRNPEAFHENIIRINDLMDQGHTMLLTGIIAPQVIMEYLEQNTGRGENGKKKDKTDPETEKWLKIKHDYQALMSKVHLSFVPLKNTDISAECDDCNPAKVCNQQVKEFSADRDKYFQCLICCELHVSDHLCKFNEPMQAFLTELKKEPPPHHLIEERIIERILEISSGYYDNLLSACTPMEKFVLSDMADDNVVNIKNSEIIKQLISRGLLTIKDSSIRIMNESFHRFVRLKINKQEKEKLKQSFGDTGAGWKGYKLFLILLLVGVILFLFLANRDIFENLSRLFAVATGGIILITNITGFISRGSGG